MESPVVIDIGANVGYFSLYVLSELKTPILYSYEPMKNNYSLMNRYSQIVRNKLWKIENKAVGGVNGEVNLHYNSSDSFTTSASFFEQDDEPDSIKVECITLEDIIKDNKIAAIDILKLDCEGAEYEILYSCSDAVLHKIRSITMETHLGDHERHNRVALTQFLEAKGFITSSSGDIVWAWR